MSKHLFLVPVLIWSAATACAAVETYKIDAAHSAVGFKIRHIVTPVPGAFAKFDGTITVDRDDLEKSSVTATIDVASVTTANQRRDNHLRTPDFFAVEQFPQMTFKSTAWKKTGENTFDVTGDLTIKDVTKPVTLAVSLLGFAPAGNNRHVSGWEATTRINRRDWGITGGPAIVGNDVEIHITIEAQRQNT